MLRWERVPHGRQRCTARRLVVGDFWERQPELRVCSARSSQRQAARASSRRSARRTRRHHRPVVAGHHRAVRRPALATSKPATGAGASVRCRACRNHQRGGEHPAGRRRGRHDPLHGPLHRAWRYRARSGPEADRRQVQAGHPGHHDPMGADGLGDDRREVHGRLVGEHRARHQPVQPGQPGPGGPARLARRPPARRSSSGPSRIRRISRKRGGTPAPTTARSSSRRCCCSATCCCIARACSTRPA